MKITNLQTTAQAAEHLKPAAAITGGSENLIVYQYWNGEQVTDTLTARNAGGGATDARQTKF